MTILIKEKKNQLALKLETSGKPTKISDDFNFMNSKPLQYNIFPISCTCSCIFFKQRAKFVFLNEKNGAGKSIFLQILVTYYSVIKLQHSCDLLAINENVLAMAPLTFVSQC